jgi:hypothetical protein
MPSSSIRTFSDPYEYGQSVRGGVVKAFGTARGDITATLTRIDLHRLWMQRGDTTLPQIMHIAVDQRRSTIFFLADPLQGSEHQGGVQLFPREILRFCFGAEHHRRAHADNRWAAMSLPLDDFTAAGQALAGREMTAPRLTHAIRPQPALMSRLMQLHKAAVELAQTTPDILTHPEVAKAMEQELARTMVACLTTAEIAEGSRSCRHGSSLMRRFEQVLETHENEPLYIPDIPEICAQIGVTDRRSVYIVRSI